MRLGAPSAAPPPGGVHVILDARPLQDPDRSPTTAAYLASLLEAFDADPIHGESFTFVVQADLPDPTTAFRRLRVAGRRPLPPTRLLKGGALAVDPFLLRAAALGVRRPAGVRSRSTPSVPAVFHAAGGALPVPLPGFSSLPSVVTLLDLAAWELPEAFGRSPAVRFGQWLRSRVLHEAAAVVVGAPETAREARRLLRLRRERLRVVPLAPRPAFRDPAGPDATAACQDRERLGLPQRHLVYSGRFDARHDVGSLIEALSLLAAAGRPRPLAADVPWPPRVLLVDASPDDRAALARAASRAGVGDTLAYAQRLAPERLAGLVRAARATILPVVSESAGLAALDSIAAGTPVVASAVGPLPAIVGAAGIVVRPRDPDALARALATVWADDRVHARLAAATQARAASLTRTWADVAADTRAVYAEVAAGFPG